MGRTRQALPAAAILAVASAAAASETATYSYDALGRLNDVSVSGGPNAGEAAATRYDPAGNRTTYSVSGAGPSGQAAASQSSSSGELVTGLDEESIGEDVQPTLVEPPPPGGVPDEAEPIVELGAPEGAAGDPGDAR